MLVCCNEKVSIAELRSKRRRRRKRKERTKGRWF